MAAPVDDRVDPRGDADDFVGRGGTSGEGESTRTSWGQVGAEGRRHPPWARRAAGKGNARLADGRRRGREGRRVDRRGRAGDRAHRRGDLDRLRHPRLPRPAGGVDEEPRGREGGDAAALSRRSRRAPGGVADPVRVAGVGRPSRTAGTAPSSSSSVRASCTRSSPRTSTASTSAPGTIPTASSRCTARCGGRAAGAATTGGRWPRPSIGSAAARRIRRACVCGGDHQERHDLVRPGAGARGHRPGDARQRRVRPAPRGGLDPQRLPGRQLRAARPRPMGRGS